MRKVELAVAPKQPRKKISVSLYPDGQSGWDQVFGDDMAKPGETAIYMARSQIVMKSEKIFCPDGAEIMDVATGGWRQGRDGGSIPTIQVSIPVFITMRVGIRNEPPMICGVADGGYDIILPFHEVRKIPVPEATIPPKADVILSRAIEFDFIPRRFVVTDGRADGVVVSDIKIGRNSTIASSGFFPLSYLDVNRSPRMAINGDRPIPPSIQLSVRLTNLSDEPRRVVMVVEGEGVPPPDTIGIVEMTEGQD